MPLNENAALAVRLYKELLRTNEWSIEDAWKAIAKLFLTCGVYERGWSVLFDGIVFAERNIFNESKSQTQNSAMRAGSEIADLLAKELKVTRQALCSEIGLYWQEPLVSNKQPHNLIGHAFRSVIAETLRVFGAKGLDVSEEEDPYKLFAGFGFTSRSKNPRIDIVVKKNAKPVALISTRWRFRHDRVDLIDESRSYLTAARSVNSNCKFYAVIGEFAASRINKVVEHTPERVSRGAPIEACVHFAPQLTEPANRKAKEKESLSLVKDLVWLTKESVTWHG